MFFNKRKRYNSKVEELLPHLGTSIEEAGLIKSLDALDIAYSKNLSAYEAAAFIANSVYLSLVRESPEKAEAVRRKIDKTLRQWLEDEDISQNLIDWIHKNRNEAFPDSDESEEGFVIVAEEDLPEAEEGTYSEPSHPSLNMPSFRDAPLYCALKTSRYTLLFAEKPKSIAEVTSGKVGITRYNYALLVLDNLEGGGAFYITSETGLSGTPFLCIFDELGRHFTLRRADEIRTKEQFAPVALEIACQRFNIHDKDLKAVDEA